MKRVVEVLGTPKSGKSSAIRAVGYSYWNLPGVSVRYESQFAGGDSFLGLRGVKRGYNLACGLASLCRAFERVHDHDLIVERGPLDAALWADHFGGNGLLLVDAWSALCTDYGVTWSPVCIVRTGEDTVRRIAETAVCEARTRYTTAVVVDELGMMYRKAWAENGMLHFDATGKSQLEVNQWLKGVCDTAFGVCRG